MADGGRTEGAAKCSHLGGAIGAAKGVDRESLDAGGALKSLLGGVVGGGVLGLLPGRAVENPGEHSLRLGTAWAV